MAPKFRASGEARGGACALGHPIGATLSVSLKDAMNWSKLRGGVEFGARSWFMADDSAHTISTFMAQGVPTALAAATLLVAKFRRDT